MVNCWCVFPARIVKARSLELACGIQLRTRPHPRLIKPQALVSPLDPSSYLLLSAFACRIYHVASGSFTSPPA